MRSAFPASTCALLVLLPSSFPAAQQGSRRSPTAVVVGVIRDSATKLPVAGAQVLIQKQKDRYDVVATTDTVGRYQVTGVPRGEHSFVARRIGFGPDTQRVVVGSAPETRADFTLAARAIALSFSRSIDNPSLWVATAHGEVTGQSVRIRGSGAEAMLSSASPLVVVDRFPVYRWFAHTDTMAKAAQRIYSLSYLDPASIESIEALKDAAAVAQYGTIAANGAIIVHTKSAAGGAEHASYLLDWLLEQYPVPSVAVTPAHRAALERIQKFGPIRLRRTIENRVTTRHGEVYVRGDIAIANPDSIARGSLAHNVPPSMRQGVGINVEAALARGKLFSQTLRLVGSVDTIFINSIMVPKFADLVLEAESGDTSAFRIVTSALNGVKEIRLDSINRILRDTVPVRWAWKITPMRGGNFILRFILLGVRRDRGKADTLTRVTVATVKVPVTVDYWFETKRRGGVVESHIAANLWLYGPSGALLALLAWGHERLRKFLRWLRRKAKNE